MKIERHISNKLKEWKSSNNRKPLILRGARQVGKTTLVKHFSKTFRHAILLNLEKASDVRFFNDYDSVQTIKDALFFEYNITNNTEDTLLFIDEIQESPKAIQQLRYFYEEIPQIHIIAAGSLLEFSIKTIKVFLLAELSISICIH